jgi:hypothetical protein
MCYNCKCNELPLIFYYEDVEEDFYKHLNKEDSSVWLELFKCKSCGQYWRIDVFDKLQARFVVKIEDIKNWKEFDASLLVKRLILKNRGGSTNKECVWANCTNKRVKGVAYCIDHLYDCGIRR